MPGIPRLLSSMVTFKGVSFFLGDEMHLVCRGISALVYNLLDPKSNSKFYDIDPETSDKIYTFELLHSSPNIMTNIGKLVKKSRVNIPHTFEGSWDDIVGFYRAVDYLDFFLYVVPTIIVPLLKVDSTKSALMDLINGCMIALQWDISSSDINKMNL